MAKEELMEEMDNEGTLITLEDEEGNEVDFEFLDVVEYEGEEYIVLIENGTLVISYNGKFWQDNYGQPVNSNLRIFGWTEYPTEVIDSVTKNNAFKYLNEEGEI